MSTSFMEALRSARYVAFGGCGLKGVSYLGCLRALQKYHSEHTAWHRQLRGTCGSSSGCIAALAFIVDADADMLIEKWRSLHVETVIPCADFQAILNRYGVDAGDEVKRIIRTVFTACGLAHDTTFRTLHRLTGRDLRICVTNLSRSRLDTFNHLTTPDVVVADAIYWSMTVPFVFQPETYKGDLMVDGCVLAYVPHDVWPLEESVVVYANGPVTGGTPALQRREISDLRSFALGLLSCCAQTVYKIVDEKSKAHPERFVHVGVVDEQHDVSFTMSTTTFEALIHLGFSAVFLRLHPNVALVLDGAVRMSLELQKIQDDEHGIHEQL